MKDWRGTDITIGSTIVYPGRHSSSLWMTEAIVLNITERKTWQGAVPVLIVLPIQSTGYAPAKPRKVVLTALERITVLG